MGASLTPGTYPTPCSSSREAPYFLSYNRGAIWIATSALDRGACHGGRCLSKCSRLHVLPLCSRSRCVVAEKKKISPPPPQSVSRSKEQVYNGCSGLKIIYGHPQNLIYRLYSIFGNGLSDARGSTPSHMSQRGLARANSIIYVWIVRSFHELSVGTCLPNSSVGCGSPTSWPTLLK